MGHFLGEFIRGEYIRGGGHLFMGDFFRRDLVWGALLLGDIFLTGSILGVYLLRGGTDFSIYWRGIFMEASISGGQFSGGWH